MFASGIRRHFFFAALTSFQVLKKVYMFWLCGLSLTQCQSDTLRTAEILREGFFPYAAAVSMVFNNAA
jgi:hypothetical protein